jgi:hypothetical protein
VLSAENARLPAAAGGAQSGQCLPGRRWLEDGGGSGILQAICPASPVQDMPCSSFTHIFRTFPRCSHIAIVPFGKVIEFSGFLIALFFFPVPLSPVFSMYLFLLRRSNCVPLPSPPLPHTHAHYSAQG